jgi:glyoxylase-like metal-dependent hydrolase (beta-lactamase superfamily II)
VLDYNPTTRTISTTTADALLRLVHRSHYTVTHILETHAHADHLTAAFYLQRKLTDSQREKGVRPLVGIGERIGRVQRLFGERYGVDRAEYEGVFDLLLGDGEVVRVGGLAVRVVHLPGHTPDHVGFWVGGECFLFYPVLFFWMCLGFGR